MGKKLQPQIVGQLDGMVFRPTAFGEAELLPVVKSTLALIRGGSQRRIVIEANDLNRFLLSDDGLKLLTNSPAMYGAISFAIKLLTMHANDTTPAKVPGRGASLAILAPQSIGGRARIDDD